MRILIAMLFGGLTIYAPIELTRLIILYPRWEHWASYTNAPWKEWAGYTNYSLELGLTWGLWLMAVLFVYFGIINIVRLIKGVHLDK